MAFVAVMAALIVAVSATADQAANQPDESSRTRIVARGHGSRHLDGVDPIILAQRPPVGDRDGRQTGGRSDDSFQKVRTMVMYKLVEKLDIDEDTAAKFLPVFLTFMKQRDELHHEHRLIIREIIDGADDESVSIDTLKKKIENLEDNEKKLESIRKNFNDGAKKYLNERQVIKLRVFDDILKQDIIIEMRERRGRNSEDTQVPTSPR